MKGHDVMRVAGALLLALSLAGCFSIDDARGPRRTDNIVVSNYGWYLFHSLPLVCGDVAAYGEDPSIAFFEDHVTHDCVQRALVEQAQLHPGKRLDDLVWTTHENVLFTIPGLSAVPLPIPYLLVYREIQLSGVMK